MSNVFATYREALDYLFHFTDYERMHRVKKATSLFGLSRMNELLEWCGNPHLKLRAVHIAGTKGKGSTAAMIASILRQTGRKVGLYTSPHLTDIRERIDVNGMWIPEADVTRILNRLHPYLVVAERGGDTYAPTFFETFTVISFLYFLEQQVDVAVVEVGLGGRLDATNVLRPEVCAITPISRDHTEKLGDEIAEIAWEKAGIIKSGVPVVSGVQQPEALEVIRARCAELGSPLHAVGADIAMGPERNGTFAVRTWRRAIGGLTVPLVGRHQQENAATAIGIAEVLAERGLDVSDECVRRGLAEVHWPGRIQTVATEPEIIVDGAHNPASIAVLVEALAAMPKKRTIFIVGIARDKEIRAMVELLAPHGDRFIVTKTANPRAAEPEELRAAIESVAPQKMALVAESPAAALRIARDRVGPADRIVATGSMYLAGDVLTALR